ncbi:hypothetical protein FD04_GL001853 [Secundilactobacillus odoratitofui DSM 19909 = JCM 15043]|uniref:Uncharacterized protein n=1 Tax=Secundilactobacillus odoratitofui DSM 19909 = JCM 15043 TaxID=1423776 RepID=A0A0R1LMB5_9LACO|nr:hypothetical protein [Secundilactobacillus odoratitofui]KRK96997.1 hypothetical protein FD04_GL001853 [Secundilactobacillus odoratitofui DSM 19909 = JCM 15043]
MSDHYQSPFQDLNTDKRFNLANQLATTYQLDVSQILFTYLKVAQPILAKQSRTNQISEKAQREIDTQFEQTLKSLSQLKE